MYVCDVCMYACMQWPPQKEAVIQKQSLKFLEFIPRWSGNCMAPGGAGMWEKLCWSYSQLSHSSSSHCQYSSSSSMSGQPSPTCLVGSFYLPQSSGSCPSPQPPEEPQCHPPLGFFHCHHPHTQQARIGDQHEVGKPKKQRTCA